MPVFSYSDIESNLDEEKLSSDISSLVFLNCGAKLDFTEYWFHQRENPVKTFVFDSQRPIHHNNVLTNNAVYVVDFGDIKVGECPEDADRDAAQEEMADDDEDQPVDGEKEYQMIINGGKAKQLSHDDAEGDVEEDKEDEDFDPDLLGKKRSREDESKDDPVADKKKRAMRFYNYYYGNYYSKSCAYLVY